MGLIPTPPKYRAVAPCEKSEVECELSIEMGHAGEYVVDIDGEEFPACLIPDIIEFLKIAQAWIDANRDNA